MAIHEPNISEENIRMKFVQHWERGVQLLGSNLKDEDWIETIEGMIR